MTEYPKWKYKGSGRTGVLVEDVDAEIALGDGYTDAPTAEDPVAPVDPKDEQIAVLTARVAELEQQLADAPKRRRSVEA